MSFIADILLIAGALGAGFYCLVLSRRLSRLNDLETGVGGAVAVLSAQVDDLSKTLIAAQETAGASATSLENLTKRAEAMSGRLELHLASMQDVPEKSAPSVPDPSTEPVIPQQVEPVFVRHPQRSAQ